MAEGWLDEGFTSFQTTWFQEAMGRPSGYPGDEAQILDFDLDDVSEPPSLPGEAYRDFVSYNIAIYTRGELFFHQLRYVVGDETMHQILRTFYERWKYRHVDEAAFRSVAEEVSKRISRPSLPSGCTPPFCTTMPWAGSRRGGPHRAPEERRDG